MPALRKRQQPVLKDKTGVIMVSRAYYHDKELVGDVHNEEQHIPVPLFNTEPARVRVEGSVTMNTGDFNSARVAVIIELPCYPVKSEIDRAYTAASDMVYEYVERERELALHGEQKQKV
jgi:hypothetical protein